MATSVAIYHCTGVLWSRIPKQCPALFALRFREAQAEGEGFESKYQSPIFFDILKAYQPFVLAAYAKNILE